MSAQLKDLIDKCSICQSVKPEQVSEPLQPHPVPDRPWQRVAIDLFTFENRNYLVLVDYYRASLSWTILLTLRSR